MTGLYPFWQLRCLRKLLAEFKRPCSVLFFACFKWVKCHDSPTQSDRLDLETFSTRKARLSYLISGSQVDTITTVRLLGLRSLLWHALLCTVILYVLKLKHRPTCLPNIDSYLKMKHVKRENKGRAITNYRSSCGGQQNGIKKCLLNSHLIYAHDNMMNFANESSISISGKMFILLLQKKSKQKKYLL